MQLDERARDAAIAAWLDDPEWQRGVGIEEKRRQMDRAILAYLSTLQGAEQKPVAVLHRKEGLGPYIETLDEAWKIGTGHFDLFAAPAALKSAERQP